jgi:ACS family D-galactonate transporter-like MFS transporter
MPPGGTSTTIDAPRTNVRWRIFFLLLFMVTINYVDRTSLSVALPIISTEFHLEPAMQGVLLSSFFWTYCLMQIPGGMLADWLKPRIVISGACIIWGLFQCLAAAAIGTTTLLISRLGLGAAEGPIYPAGGKLNGMWMPLMERGRGAALLDSGAPLGAAFGALIIATLISWFGSWRLAFLIAGVGTVACGVLAWWYIRNSPAEHPSANAAEAAYIEAGQRSGIGRDESETATNHEIFTNPSVWLMFLGWIGCNSIWTGLLTWMPTYLASTQKLNITTLGGFSFIIFLSGAAGEMVGGFILDALTRSKLPRAIAYRLFFGISAVIATTALFVLAYLHDTTQIVVLLAGALFFTRWSNLYWVLPPLLAGPGKAGLLGGCMNFGTNAYAIFTTLLIGFIVQMTGSYFAVLIFFGGMGTLLLVCSLSIRYSRPDRPAATFRPAT